MKFLISIFVIFLFKSWITVGQEPDHFPITIIHFNDMHARFDETNEQSNTCKEGDFCIGGYARVVAKVKQLKAEKLDKNPIFLNAADNFQGTLWYNEFRWNVTSHFLNLYPADATTIGNHEFDHGIPGLVPFMNESVAPILVSNVDDSQEISFQGNYKPSMIFDKYERKVGIVGVTTTFRSNWGNVVITDEIEAVRREVEILKSQNISIIIVLSHCGLDVDKRIAQSVGDIDIIVGGHSHSFLYSGNNPPGPDIPVDGYPTIVERENDEKVLIVQASAFTKYLGDITLYFDEDGIVQSYDGAPHFLGHNEPQDPEILLELQPWKDAISAIQNRIIGSSKYEISSHRCYAAECSMGNLLTDAYAYSFLDNTLGDEGWAGATISLTNPGGIRAGLSRGTIVYGDLITTTPFENDLVSIEIQGKYIREALEFSVRNLDSIILLQVSGLKVVYDTKRNESQRVVSVHALCRICENNVPRYELLEDEKNYRVVMASFLADGGDDFTMIGDNAKNKIIGKRDIDALTDYVEKFSPLIVPNALGRIIVI